MAALCSHSDTQAKNPGKPSKTFTPTASFALQNAKQCSAYSPKACANYIKVFVNVSGASCQAISTYFKGIP